MDIEKYLKEVREAAKADDASGATANRPATKAATGPSILDLQQKVKSDPNAPDLAQIFKPKTNSKLESTVTGAFQIGRDAADAYQGSEAQKISQQSQKVQSQNREIEKLKSELGSDKMFGGVGGSGLEQYVKENTSAGQNRLKLEAKIGELEAERDAGLRSVYERDNLRSFERLNEDTEARKLYDQAKQIYSNTVRMPQFRNISVLPGTNVTYKSLVEQLKEKGFDFERMRGYEQRQTDKAEAAAKAKSQEQFAKEHPVLGSLATIPAAAVKGAEFLGSSAEVVFNSNVDSPMNYVPQNIYQMTATNFVSNIRGTVSKELEENTDFSIMGTNLASFLYNTGMSIADSATMVAAAGPAATLLLGGSAAADKAKTVVERGGTNRQAFMAGLAAGAAEAIFEKFSIENLLSQKSVDGVLDFIKNVVKQSGVEASEEAFTEVANLLSDAVILGQKADAAIALRQYMSQGMRYEDAQRQVLLDCIGQVALAAVGGAISGGAMTSLYTAPRSALNYYFDSQTGKQVALSNEQYDTVEAALRYAPDSETHKLAVKIQNALDSSEAATVSDAQLGRLVQLMEQERSSAAPETTMERAAVTQAAHTEATVVSPTVQALIEAGESTQNAQMKGEILDRLLAGNIDVTNSQIRKLNMRSPAVQQVFTELTGIEIPETNDTQTLLKVFRSAAEAANAAQSNAEEVERVAAEQMRSLAREASALADEVEARKQAAAPEAAAIMDQAVTAETAARAEAAEEPAVLMSDGTTRTRDQFVAERRAESPDMSDVRAEQLYQDALRYNRTGAGYPVVETVAQNPASNAQAETGAEKRNSVASAPRAAENAAQGAQKPQREANKSQEWTVKHINAVLPEGAPKVVLRFGQFGDEVNAYHEGDTIVLNGDRLTTQKEIVAILGHELVHPASREDGGELVRSIMEFAEQLLGAEELEQIREETLSTYLWHYQFNEKRSEADARATCTPEFIEEEVAADQMSVFFSKSGALYQMAKSHRSVVERARDLVVGMIDKLVGRKLRGAEGAEAQAVKNELQSLVNKMDRALRAGQPSSTMNANQEARYSIGSAKAQDVLRRLNAQPAFGSRARVENPSYELQKALYGIPEYVEIREMKHVQSLASEGPRQKYQREAYNTLAARGAYSGRDAQGNALWDGEVRQERKAFLVIGWAGAGKSSTLVNPLSQEHGARVIDVDDARDFFPEYKGGKGSGDVHDESKGVHGKLLETAMARGDNLVWPTVGADQKDVTDDIAKLHNAGYYVTLALVDVTRSQALARQLNRFLTDGRFTPPKIVLNAVETPYEVFEALKQEGVVEDTIYYDNRKEKKHGTADNSGKRESEDRGAQNEDRGPGALDHDAASASGAERGGHQADARAQAGGSDRHSVHQGRHLGREGQAEVLRAGTGEADYERVSLSTSREEKPSWWKGTWMTDRKLDTIAKNKNFKAYFANAGEFAFDEQGRPKPLFSGTEMAGFMEFRNNMEPGDEGEPGTWFTPDPLTARNYADSPNEFIPFVAKDWTDAAKKLKKHLPGLELEYDEDEDSYFIVDTRIEDGYNVIPGGEFFNNTADFNRFNEEYATLARDYDQKRFGHGIYQVFHPIRKPLVVKCAGHKWNDLNPYMLESEILQEAAVDYMREIVAEKAKMGLLEGVGDWVKGIAALDTSAKDVTEKRKDANQKAQERRVIPPMATRDFVNLAYQLSSTLGYDSVVFLNIRDGRSVYVPPTSLAESFTDEDVNDALKRNNYLGYGSLSMAKLHLDVDDSLDLNKFNLSARDYQILSGESDSSGYIQWGHGGHVSDTSEVVVSLHPEDIKSVHNSGTWGQTKSKDIRYSVSRKDIFAKQVEDALHEKLEENQHNALYIRNTPNLLSEVGLGDLPLCMTAAHVKAATAPKGSRITTPSGQVLHGHGLQPGLVKRIPELVSKPAMLVESMTKGGSVVVVTTAVDRDGNPVVIPIKPNGLARVEGEFEPANFVLSIYGKENFTSWINNAADQGKILYWDEKRTQQLHRLARLSLPTSVSAVDSDTILRQHEKYVKGEIPTRRFSVGGYSYDELVQKPPVRVVELGETSVPEKSKKVDQSAVVNAAKKKASVIAGDNRKSQRYVYIPDIDANVLLPAKGMRHGLQGKITNSSTASTAEVTPSLPNILRNSVAVNELNPRPEEEWLYSRVLFGLAQNASGQPYLVKSTVRHFGDNHSVVSSVEVFDVLYSAKARKMDTTLMGSHTGRPAARVPYFAVSTEVSIVELLELVKDNYPEFLPDDVREQLGVQEAAKESTARYSVGKKTGGNTGNVNPDTGYERGSVADSFMRIMNAGDKEAALSMLEQMLTRLAESAAEQAEQRQKDLTGQVFRPKLTEEAAARNRRTIEQLIQKYGEMEQTSRAQREVHFPNQIDDKTHTRGFMQTAAAARVTPEALISQFEADIVSGEAGATYTPIGDTSTLNSVREQLEKKGFEECLKDWDAKVRQGERFKKEDIALGEQLYVEACANRDIDTAQRLAAEIAAIGTQAGQVVQAMTLLSKMTPSGQLYYLTKVVDRVNKEFANRKKAEIQIPEALALKLLKAETTEEIRAAMDEIIQSLADQTPVTLVDKWNTWRYLAMLGNPRTHFRNMMGNAAFTPARLVKDMMGAGIENAFVRAGKMRPEERTKSVRTSKEMRDFAKQDAIEMEDILRNGGKYNPVDLIRDKRVIYKHFGILEAARKKNSELLELEDWFFLHRAYEFALSGFLTARGFTAADVQGPNSTREGRAALSQARVYAVKEAQRATFRDMSRLANMLNHAKRNTGPLGALLLDGVLPFTKTPINIVKRGVEYSPVGLIKSIKDLTTKVRKGDMSASEFVDEFCVGMTGTMIAAVGYTLAKLGVLVSGLGDSEEDEFEKLQGEQEYSIKFGDLSYTVDWTAPSALPLFVGAELQRLRSSEGNSAWDIPDALTTLFEPVLSLSMLDGLNQTLSANRFDSEDKAVWNILKTVAASYATQGVPTLAGQIARTMDGTRRTSFTPKGMSDFQGWLNRAWQSGVAGKIPVVSEGRMAYVDAWGRVETDGSIAVRAFENFLSPGYISMTKTSPMEEELKRLAEATGNSNVLPGRAQKYFKVNNEDYAMTQEEYQKHLIDRGQTSFRLANDIVNDPSYRKLDDTTKAQAVELAYEYAASMAKVHTTPEYAGAAKWHIELEKLEREGGDAAEYLILRARAKTAGISLTDVALRDDSLTAFEVARIVAMETTMPSQFTDPYLSGRQYILTEEQKKRYASTYEELFAEEFQDLLEKRKYQEGDAAVRKELVQDMKSDVSEQVKREIADWLWEQGIKSTPKE